MKASPLLLAALLLTSACGRNDATSAQDAPAAVTDTNADYDGDDMRLYVLDCGRIDVLDLSLFDAGGAYDGRQDTYVDSCYLLRHPKGDFLWDAGLPDALNELPDGVTSDAFKAMVPKTLQGQLERLGAPPADIEFFSISHSHFDHTGNGGLFAGSTFIVNEAEREHMFRDEARADKETFANYAALENANTVTYTDSYDVFGDKRAMIISMPGHTPGHAVLYVNLTHSGPILLSGDLYHLTEAREKRTVPVFNTDADATRASMDAFEKLARESGARVIIQHEDDDFRKLPHAPAYLD